MSEASPHVGTGGATPAESLEGGLQTRLEMARISRELFGDEAQVVEIGRFVVTDRLGSGGMGTVFEAFDPDLDRRVAIKVMKSRAVEPDAGAHDRMAREAKALAKLNHPNVVAVHEVGTAHGRMFVAMELVEGQDLAKWMAEHPWTPARFDAALDLIVQAGRGLAAAHAAGVVHRDFKPANLLIGTDGRVRVADFGLARWDATTQTSQSDATSQTSVSGPLLTKTGAVVGTPAYMAPEQRLGDPIDARADQYAFCVTAWEALYGARPRGAEADQSALPSGISARARFVARILRRGLAADPAGRHPSMQELLAGLERDPIRRRRALVLGGAVLVLGGAGFAAHRVELAGRCADANADAAALFGADRRERIAAAFAASPWAMARDSWSRFEANVDAYLDEWSSLAVADCKAARIEGTLDMATHDARAQCLAERLQRLDALLEVFEAPDQELVISAPVTSSALAPLQPCIARPDRSTDAPQAITEQLARALGVLDAGRHREAAQAFEAVAAAAHEAGAPLAEARAQLGHGQALLEAEGAAQTQRAFESAYWIALEHGDDEVASSAARGMVDALVLTEKLTEAGSWAQHAEVLGRRAEADDDLRSATASSLARYAYERGDAVEAERGMREALRLAVGLWGPDHPRVVSDEQNLALVLRTVGKFDEASQLAEHGYAVRLAHFGPQHPSVAHSLSNVAMDLGRRGQHAEAATKFEEAIAIFEAAYGRKHVLVAQALTNLGVSYDHAGDDPAAARAHREALEIYEGLLDPHDTRVLTARMNLGATQVTVGDCEGAVTNLGEVVASLAARTPGHPRLAVAKTILGACLGRLQRYDEALTELRAAAEVFENDPDNHASVRVSMATVLEAKGDLAGARTEVTAALQTLETSGQRATHAEALQRLASIELGLGRTDDALRQSERALAMVRELVGDRPALVDALAERAAILHTAGRTDDAVALAREGVALAQRPDVAAILAPPAGGRIQLVLAECLAGTDATASKAAAAEAKAWFARTDRTFDAQRARAAELAR